MLRKQSILQKLLKLLKLLITLLLNYNICAAKIPDRCDLLEAENQLNGSKVTFQFLAHFDRKYIPALDSLQQSASFNYFLRTKGWEWSSELSQDNQETIITLYFSWFFTNLKAEQETLKDRALKEQLESHGYDTSSLSATASTTASTTARQLLARLSQRNKRRLETELKVAAPVPNVCCIPQAVGE